MTGFELGLYTRIYIYIYMCVLLAEWLVLWTSTQSTWFDSQSEHMSGSDSSIIGGPVYWESHTHDALQKNPGFSKQKE